jgi:DNA-binding transcriptional LysR family regulator
MLCAAPAYLERHGTPAAPQDLPGHQWLALAREEALTASQALPVTLDLQAADGSMQHTAAEARIVSNNQLALQQMCEHGLGLARLAHADVRTSLERGVLVQVLPSWKLAPLPVWAVTPQREREAAKVRVAVDCLKRYFPAIS